MNNAGQKRKRVLLAACLALLLALPFSSQPVVPSVIATPGQNRSGDFFRPARAEAKPDAENTGCTGKATLRPGERTSGRGTDSNLSPKILTNNRIAYQLTNCCFVCGNNKHFTQSTISLAAHGCRAPPVFFS